jgi:flagellar biosynthesis protein FlhG
MNMKGIKDQTYYEILEISPTATSKEIQRAYEHAKETFHADSVAVYSLFSEDEVKEIADTVEEAYRVLMDEGLRESYNQSHLPVLPVAEEEPTEAFSEAFGTTAEKRPSLSFTALSFNVEDGPYRGKTLKQVREGMGVELQTIANEMKINIRTLEWIEEEAFEKLPALVYLKGFLKSYAQSLGLDPSKVAEEYILFKEGSKKT